MFFSCEKGLNVDPSPIQNDLEAQGTNASIGRKHWWSSILNQIFLPHLDSLKNDQCGHQLHMESRQYGWNLIHGIIQEDQLDSLKCTCNLIVKCPKRDPYATTELEWQNKRSLCPHGFSRDKTPVVGSLKWFPWAWVSMDSRSAYRFSILVREPQICGWWNFNQMSFPEDRASQTTYI